MGRVAGNSKMGYVYFQDKQSVRKKIFTTCSRLLFLGIGKMISKINNPLEKDFYHMFSIKIITGCFVVRPAITLNLDGAPIASHSHTHPSHSQTSRLLSLSLSLGVPVPRPTQCIRGT
jgi:hypothetical protein